MSTQTLEQPRCSHGTFIPADPEAITTCPKCIEEAIAPVEEPPGLALEDALEAVGNALLIAFGIFFAYIVLRTAYEFVSLFGEHLRVVAVSVSIAWVLYRAVYRIRNEWSTA